MNILDLFRIDDLRFVHTQLEFKSKTEFFSTKYLHDPFADV